MSGRYERKIENIHLLVKKAIARFKRKATLWQWVFPCLKAFSEDVCKVFGDPIERRRCINCVMGCVKELLIRLLRSRRVRVRRCSLMVHRALKRSENLEKKYQSTGNPIYLEQSRKWSYVASVLFTLNPFDICRYYDFCYEDGILIRALDIYGGRADLILRSISAIERSFPRLCFHGLPDVFREAVLGFRLEISLFKLNVSVSILDSDHMPVSSVSYFTDHGLLTASGWYSEIFGSLVMVSGYVSSAVFLVTVSGYHANLYNYVYIAGYYAST